MSIVLSLGIARLGSLPKPPAGQKADFEFSSLLAYCKLGRSVTFPAGSMNITALKNPRY
jgi:hypothetical protein